MPPARHNYKFQVYTGKEHGGKKWMRREVGHALPAFKPTNHRPFPAHNLVNGLNVTSYSLKDKYEPLWTISLVTYAKRFLFDHVGVILLVAASRMCHVNPKRRLEKRKKERDT